MKTLALILAAAAFLVACDNTDDTVDATPPESDLQDQNVTADAPVAPDEAPGEPPQEPSPASVSPRGANYSLHANDNFARNVYWGDTHVHSLLSMDANMFGNRKLSPTDAFRFARGELVTTNTGKKIKLRRPLDFLVVADHAEYLGVMDGILRSDEELLQNETARRWQKQLAAGDMTPMTEFARSLSDGKNLVENSAFENTVWRRVIDGADAQNTPGVFTAFIGYEWTSMPGANNLHRVVIFRDGADKTSQVLPFSSLDSDEPEDLWAYLSAYADKTGGQAIAIPHNSNLSGGLMFREVMSDGKPITADYAQARALYEPLVEATQVKGDSETHPFLSPDDEFADYESWDKSNIGLLQPHQDEWFAKEYVRSALKTGLAIEAEIGVNPYRFGLIGSTDSHTSLATADENDYWGKFVDAHPSADRWKQPMVPAELPFMTYEWEMAASGYAGVWARENTREAIFDAMRRRETYATTGPRMTVRLFGGWSFSEEDAVRPDLAKTGYEKGVPMGGVLPTDGQGAAPSFLISALKDPDGANLDRVQIVKGWLDQAGNLQEQVFDVAVSDGRTPGANGKIPPVGSTVDAETATYTNTIGAAQFIIHWRDPDFNATRPAFYYVRVLEIPTPRWTTYDAAIYGLTLPDEVPRTTQERAYTSAIWYTPQN